MARKDGIFRLLDTVGDGSGVTNAIGDYSGTQTSFKITDTTGWGQIERILVSYRDSGAFDTELYGNGIALTNGVRCILRNSDDEIIQEYTAYPILSNGDWAAHCYDWAYFEEGTGDNYAAIRWTFSKSGQPVIVKFDKGEYFEVLLNDDFSGLIEHRFNVQGKYITREE